MLKELYSVTAANYFIDDNDKLHSCSQGLNSQMIYLLTLGLDVKLLTSLYSLLLFWNDVVIKYFDKNYPQITNDARRRKKFY